MLVTRAPIQARCAIRWQPFGWLAVVTFVFVCAASSLQASVITAEGKAELSSAAQMSVPADTVDLPTEKGNLRDPLNDHGTGAPPLVDSGAFLSWALAAQSLPPLKPCEFSGNVPHRQWFAVPWVILGTLLRPPNNQV